MANFRVPGAQKYLFDINVGDPFRLYPYSVPFRSVPFRSLILIPFRKSNPASAYFRLVSISCKSFYWSHWRYELIGPINPNLHPNLHRITKIESIVKLIELELQLSELRGALKILLSHRRLVRSSILIKALKQGETSITEDNFSELVHRLIQEDAEAQRPLLASLIINNHSNHGIPGRGFYQMAMAVGYFKESDGESEFWESQLQKLGFYEE